VRVRSVREHQLNEAIELGYEKDSRMFERRKIGRCLIHFLLPFRDVSFDWWMGVEPLFFAWRRLEPLIRCEQQL
jgi:hypothetical protein